MRRIVMLLALLFLAWTPGGTASAQEGWSLTVEPYLWVPSLEGEGSAEGSPDVDIEIHYPGELSAGFPLSLRLDAPGGRWSLMLEGLYARWNDEDGSVRSETEVGLLETGVGFPLDGAFDLMAGVRAVELDFDVDVAGLEADAAEGWIDPWIGGRGEWTLGGDWSVRTWADVGGFGVGSDFSWQAAAFLAWGSARWRVELGYRALAFEFDEDDLDTELLAHGPVLGIAARF